MNLINSLTDQPTNQLVNQPTNRWTLGILLRKFAKVLTVLMRNDIWFKNELITIFLDAEQLFNLLLSLIQPSHPSLHFHLIHIGIWTAYLIF